MFLVYFESGFGVNFDVVLAWFESGCCVVDWSRLGIVWKWLCVRDWSPLDIDWGCFWRARLVFFWRGLRVVLA